MCIRDSIYTGQPIDIRHYDVDHFVPWSYITNDEIWNLMPVDSSVNSSKNNRLPIWEKYFPRFANNQFVMYENIYKYEELLNRFKDCYRDNIVSIWASEELYIQGNTKEKFYNILESNMKPIYDAARLQGYSIWQNSLCHS